MKGKPTIKQAVNCLESICNMYGLKLTMYYTPKSTDRWSPSPGWKIKVMDKIFQSVDIIKASGQAVEFVYNAHEKNNNEPTKTN